MWTMLTCYTAIILGTPFAHHLRDSLCLFPLFYPFFPDLIFLFVVHSLILAEHKSEIFHQELYGSHIFLGLCMYENVFIQPSTRGKFDSVFQENSIMNAYFHLAPLINVTTIFQSCMPPKLSLSVTFQVSFTLLLYLQIVGKFHAL